MLFPTLLLLVTQGGGRGGNFHVLPSEIGKFCYKVLPISIKKCNKGCLYLVVTVTLCYSGGVGGSPVLLLLVTQGGVGGLFFDVTCDIGGVGGGPPCYRYLLHGFRELMLPVTTVTRPPVACYALQCYSTKVRFWHVTKLKLPILAGNFQKNVTKYP